MASNTKSLESAPVIPDQTPIEFFPKINELADISR